MEYEWNMHGICMAYVGICMEYVWNMNGIYVEYVWHMLEHVWNMVEYAWNMYGVRWNVSELVPVLGTDGHQWCVVCVSFLRQETW